ncbi:uncharacterized protein N7479_008805 [Penicillium vulpinum]|uniref:uncharacterized protein n=1 Tax=Penicillium vulpinum TaxID=29845 RepID=UPI0025483537|nr:uncharacterized protein N7479_008805 [Penicillium vulpinum]KAJ5950392.1 hypothetical protein N7479_008805 [Penicillium vulpinum]
MAVIAASITPVDRVLIANCTVISDIILDQVDCVVAARTLVSSPRSYNPSFLQVLLPNSPHQEL